MRPQYRLLTRADFDGLVCAALLREMKFVESVIFVHPQDILNGNFPICDEDVLANIPYAPTCHMAFDRHVSEVMRLDPAPKFVIDTHARSTARVIYNHYGEESRFPDLPTGLMAAVDRADPAQYDVDEIVNPKGWTLLHFLTDPRTGLGRFHDFTISNRELMHELVNRLRTEPVETILAAPNVKQRADLFDQEKDPFRAQLEARSSMREGVAVVDYRDEAMIHAGSRLLVYALHPEAEAAIHVLPTKNGTGDLLAMTASPLHPNAKLNVGALMSGFGGGGHDAAGTVQVAAEAADDVLNAMIDEVVKRREA